MKASFNEFNEICINWNLHEQFTSIMWEEDEQVGVDQYATPPRLSYLPLSCYFKFVTYGTDLLCQKSDPQDE